MCGVELGGPSAINIAKTWEAQSMEVREVQFVYLQDRCFRSDGNVQENISASTSGGILLSGERGSQYSSQGGLTTKRASPSTASLDGGGGGGGGRRSRDSSCSTNAKDALVFEITESMMVDSESRGGSLEFKSLWCLLSGAAAKSNGSSAGKLVATAPHSEHRGVVI
ncbi:hypothetical protein C8R44DRAFT_728354 [Mycena epipterygia]|nr:hypothetical protein C8R44DRAFT_728354 [Mycena epipterygia]